MLKICAKDVSFATMLHKHPPPLLLVVPKQLNTNWYKWFHVVIMRSVDMSVCVDIGFHIGL